MTYRKFIILSSPRSGTHMLRTCLGGHQNLVCLSEMFNPDWYPDPPYNGDLSTEEILTKEIWGDYPSSVKAAGFCVHRSNAPMGSHKGLFGLLDRTDDLYVISLRRRNLLRQYLSFQIMKEDKKRPPTPKYFEYELLRDEFERQKRLIARFDDRFASYNIRVFYEDLEADTQKEIDRVFGFLGVDSAELKPSTIKNPDRNLVSLIQNFVDLKDQFRSTEWEPFFETSFKATQSANFEL